MYRRLECLLDFSLRAGETLHVIARAARGFDECGEWGEVTTVAVQSEQIES